MYHNKLSEGEQQEIPLKFLMKISKMIEKDATGFELAYKTKKNHLQGLLMNEGIFFYNTFINIGNKKFKDALDRKKKDFTNFKTVEDTEKHLFMIWLKDEINEREKLKEKFIFCQNCRAKNREKYQKYCEKCGFKL